MIPMATIWNKPAIPLVTNDTISYLDNVMFFYKGISPVSIVVYTRSTIWGNHTANQTQADEGQTKYTTSDESMVGHRMLTYY